MIFIDFALFFNFLGMRRIARVVGASWNFSLLYIF
jgi:hypothetical protein